MLTGYRGVILALGLILAAASPPGQRGQDQQRGSQTTAEQSLQDIAAALQDANKSDGTTKPCPKDHEDRSSDLCAQWKAADAAGASAVWTERTFWLGIGGLTVGFLTLVAAGAAAYFAHKAAVETEKGANAALDAVKETREANNISRDTAKRQLRAYLSTEEHALSGFFSGGPSLFQLKVWNRGQTPARRVKAWCVVTGTQGDPDELKIFRPNEFAQSNTTIAPGEWLLLQNDCQGPLSQDAYASVALGGVAMVFAGVVTYQDVFGKVHRTTFKQFYRGHGNWAETASDLTACGKGNYSS